MWVYVKRISQLPPLQLTLAQEDFFGCEAEIQHIVGMFSSCGFLAISF
jgi:hypothetical protein